MRFFGCLQQFDRSLLIGCPLPFGVHDDSEFVESRGQCVCRFLPCRCAVAITPEPDRQGGNRHSTEDSAGLLAPSGSGMRPFAVEGSEFLIDGNAETSPGLPAFISLCRTAIAASSSRTESETTGRPTRTWVERRTGSVDCTTSEGVPGNPDAISWLTIVLERPPIHVVGWVISFTESGDAATPPV